MQAIVLRFGYGSIGCKVARYWVPYDPAVDSDDTSSSYTSSSDERSAARRPVDLYNIVQTMDCALALTVATLVCT